MAIHSIGGWIFWWLDRYFQLTLVDKLTERTIGWLFFIFASVFSVCTIMLFDISIKIIKNRLNYDIANKKS